MFCGKVKEYLSQKQIQFDDRDITRDPSAILELQKLGFMQPVLALGFWPNVQSGNSPCAAWVDWQCWAESPWWRAEMIPGEICPVSGEIVLNSQSSNSRRDVHGEKSDPYTVSRAECSVAR